MNLKKVGSILKWITIPPLVILGYGQMAAFVYFIDWVEFARDIITEENLEKFLHMIAKVDALWHDYEMRQGVER